MPFPCFSSLHGIDGDPRRCKTTRRTECFPRCFLAASYCRCRHAALHLDVEPPQRRCTVRNAWGPRAFDDSQNRRILLSGLAWSWGVAGAREQGENGLRRSRAQSHKNCVVWQGFMDEGGQRIAGESDASYNEWITSFYWAITTMSTIGYGDISAHTAKERSVAVVMMIIGCGFFAWATGRIVNVLSKRSHSAVAFQQMIEEIDQFMSVWDALPAALHFRSATDHLVHGVSLTHHIIMIVYSCHRHNCPAECDDDDASDSRHIARRSPRRARPRAMSPALLASDRSYVPTPTSQARGVSKKIKNAVHTYYMTRFPTKHIFDESRILAEFPKNIRSALNKSLYLDVVHSKRGVRSRKRSPRVTGSMPSLLFTNVMRCAP